MKIIEITHKGEDYYKVEVNGEEFEVSLPVGAAVFALISGNKEQIAKGLVHSLGTPTGWKQSVVTKQKHGRK